MRNALRGLLTAVGAERNLQIELVAAVAWCGVMLWLGPAAIWWALSALVIALVLALELVNTALERLADRLHPEQHPDIGQAKDCAAAAVLVASLGALAFATLVLVVHLR